jgi:hypothetical protein
VIGGEGIPSRHWYKSRKREIRGNCKWVSKDWSRNNRVTPYRVFSTIFMHVYVGFSGNKCVYIGLIKERRVHLRESGISGPYNKL